MIINDIRFFNKNKSKELYKKILCIIEPEHKLCKDCGDVVYYSDVFFRV